MKSINWKHVAISWFILIATIILSHLNAQWTESKYSESIYPALHQTLSWIFSWTSFSWLLIFLLYFLYKTIVKLIETKGFEVKLFEFQFRMLWVVALFYILWGFNYGRIDLESRLGLKHEESPDTAFISLYKKTVDNLNRLSVANSTAKMSSVESFHVKETMTALGYKHLIEKVSVKPVWPKGLLLRIATAGFYFPYTFEANYDPGLHFLQLPFVKAHEIAHAYGEPEESACNFIAYIVCFTSEDPLINYAGEIALYQYLRHLVPNDIASKGRSHLKTKVIADLDQIKLEMDKYPDILPELRNLIYNAFLQIQGIHEGEKNYSKFVDLLIRWNNKK